MQNTNNRMMALVLMGLILFSTMGRANNISVANISLTNTEAGCTFVQCDVSWNNSWKASWTEGETTITNWDAAWVFIKYRVATNNAPWQHASLSTSPSDHIAPAGASLAVGLSGTKGTGVFLYRSTEGSGSWTNTLKLKWNYAEDGVSRPVPVDVQVFAIEMVYVPKGSFYLGSGGNEPGRLFEGGGGNTPFLVSNAGPLTCDNVAGSLWGTSQAGFDSMGGTGTISAAFPNGYNAFYCMKYEISQGQWVAFFNTLTASQKPTVDITGGFGGKSSDGTLFRNTVSWTNDAFDATCVAPDIACNYLDWADGTSYADWAGLRPMTELEFVKACRGPLMPAANEYAWGSSAIVQVTGVSGTDSSTETALPANANANYGNNGGVQGPVRCGIFATATSGRAASGASYWGIMEMSGNLTERPVTIGNATGRAYTGTLGDGVLSSDGRANEVSWPAGGADGTGLIGGNWLDGIIYLRTSDRSWAARVEYNRYRNTGFRAVRPAP
jgi:formylglycine-generating enzyme required for sulfatase activity